MNDFKKKLFEIKSKNPYYIHCHPIKIHSAGILVLHKLCHMLNELGYPAYMVIDREYLGVLGYPQFGVHSSLITPELTSLVLEQHFAEGKSPIAIYSDSTAGDPFGTPVISRYFLNYPGLFSGEKIFSPNEIHFSYTQSIGLKTKSPENTMFMPISDPYFFVPPLKAVRKGICYYAAKYKYAHGQNVGPEAENYFEITRDRADSLTKDQLRDLFQRSELLICYENSAIAIEAALCGCPVAFIPNPFFTEVIAKNELGMEGFAWGLDEMELNKAKQTVHLFRERYMSSLDSLEDQIESFISTTQEVANQTPYLEKVKESIAIIAIGRETPELQKVVIHLSPVFKKIKTLSGLTWKQKTTKILKKTLKVVGLFTVIKGAYYSIKELPNIEIIKKSIRTIKYTKKARSLEPNELAPHIM